MDGFWLFPACLCKHVRLVKYDIAIEISLIMNVWLSQVSLHCYCHSSIFTSGKWVGISHKSTSGTGHGLVWTGRSLIFTCKIIILLWHTSVVSVPCNWLVCLWCLRQSRWLFFFLYSGMSSTMRKNWKLLKFSWVSKKAKVRWMILVLLLLYCNQNLFVLSPILNLLLCATSPNSRFLKHG